MTSAADYIRQFRTRQSVTFTGHPSRHSNMLIRALWWKQEAWKAEAELEDAAYPSAEHDEAHDAYVSAKAKWRMAVRDAWLNRAMERGNGDAAVAIHDAGRVELRDALVGSLEMAGV